MAIPAGGFQSFTIKFNGLADRIITDIGVSEAYDPGNPPNPPPHREATKALWDTGASKSVISAELAKTLELAPVGVAKINTAAGVSSSSTYMVNLRLPHQVTIAGVLASEFPRPFAGGFDVLVGMDVIGLGDLAITNVGGQTCMSFRTPSCAEIDYVAEGNRLKFGRVGRNDPCPCGKANAEGKPVKFKKCHGRDIS